jgi:hypothetical protein
MKKRTFDIFSRYILARFSQSVDSPVYTRVSGGPKKSIGTVNDFQPGSHTISIQG